MERDALEERTDFAAAADAGRAPFAMWIQSPLSLHQPAKANFIFVYNFLRISRYQV